MRLSIVTPSYNQGRYIKETIDSVLNQQYPDLEYWVIDGGSTDRTTELLKTYGTSLHWVIEKAQGPADAVNQGILRATGDVIGWINPNDIFYPKAFEHVMQVFEDHPEVDAVYGQADRIRADGTDWEAYPTEEWSYERLTEACFLCQPAVFFRKKAVCDAGMLNIQRRFAMDYDLWLRLGKRNAFFYLHEKLAGSRLHDERQPLDDPQKAADDILTAVYENTGRFSARCIQTAVALSLSSAYPLENPSEKERRTIRQIVSCFDLSQKFHTPLALNENGWYKDLGSIRIGFDSSITCVNHAGCGFYVDSLADALGRVDHENHYLFYAMYLSRCFPFASKCTALAKTPNAQNLFCDGVSPETVDAAFRNPEADLTEMLGRPQVVHSTGFAFTPHHQAANVYTIFDSSMVDMPDCTTEENRCFCFDMMHEASLYADMFISISQYSKDRFLHYFPYVESERVRVIPLATRDTLKPNREIGCLKEFGIRSVGSYWLCVNTIEPRKNIERLLQAYALLRKKGKTRPLYLVGGKGWKDQRIYQEVQNLQLTDDVVFTSYVTDEQLSALYTNCYAFLYPSLYEGFGLPVLEAMTMGAPVISSNTTSLPEVADDTALYVDPNDTQSIVSAMLELQEHPERREQMIHDGLERAKQFSWEQNAAETIKCYYEAIWRHNRK